MPCIILRLWGFLYIRDTGRRGNKITGIGWFSYPSPICFISWQNSQHFATSPDWFAHEMISKKRMQIFYIIWKFASNSQKHFPDLVGFASSVWNLCTCFSDVISWGNQCRCHEMLALSGSERPKYTPLGDTQPLHGNPSPLPPPHPRNTWDLNPDKNLSKQGQEPSAHGLLQETTTNSTHLWSSFQDLKPGYISERCDPITTLARAQLKFYTVQYFVIKPQKNLKQSCMDLKTLLIYRFWKTELHAFNLPLFFL